MGERRYLLIDGIRGFTIINMVLYHFLYDVFIIYRRNPNWISLPAVHIWQQYICWSFIFIAGFVWRFGQKNNLKRGIFLNLCGLVITLVTYIAVPGEAIWFGILNFMGCAVLLMIPLHRLACVTLSACRSFRADRILSALGMAVSFVLFMLLKHMQSGYIGIGRTKFFSLPGWLYQIKLLTIFGFPYPGFASSDYFPVFPWMFLFATGYFCYPIARDSGLLDKIAYKKVPVLSVIGQKSIWIYLVHQPVCMLIGMLFQV